MPADLPYEADFQISQSLQLVLSQLQNGDAEPLFRISFDILVSIANRTLSPLVRGRVGGDDIAQSAIVTYWKSFKEGAQNSSLKSTRELRAWLCGIAIKKCMKKLGTQKRDPKREVPMAQIQKLESAWQPTSNEPTPDEQLAYREALAALIGSLKRQLDLDILLLYVLGSPVAKISEAVERSENTVYYSLTKVEQYLETESAKP